MARMFCRHNRLTATCPICSKDLAAELPTPPRRVGARGAAKPAQRRPGTSSTARRPGGGGVVTKRLARAADDGYRNPLVPGLRATADARRLAAALLVAASRLEPPGPVPEAAAAGDREEGAWIAFARVLGAAGDVPAWASGESPDLPPARRRAAEAYRPWAERSGGTVAALEGDGAWTPERRFARAYERLSLPGLTRHDRIEFLLALGAAGLFELEQDSLRVEREDDPATVAAKRLLVSGDRGLLDRRARELASASGIPFGAFEHGLALWDGGGELPQPDTLPERLASALDLD